MRIGVMLRAYGERGGGGVYTQNIIEELLRIDQRNEYVLFYYHRQNLGRFADHANVVEWFLWAPETATWDQLAVPIARSRHGVDVLFHPKFTAPLLTRSRVVMTVHGAEWFFPEQARFYSRLTVRYLKTFLPLYLRKCAAVISVSEQTTDDFHRALPRLSPGKIRTVYFGPARHFRRIDEPSEIARVRSRYGLPERFMLTLTKRWGGGRKNFANLVKAYARYRGHTPRPIKLAIGGKDLLQFREEYGIPSSGYGADVIFPGWLDQQDLPAIYSMADLYLYPSNLEGLSHTSDRSHGMRRSHRHIGCQRAARNRRRRRSTGQSRRSGGDCRRDRVLADPPLQQQLRDRGLARSALFQWGTCARETLAILEAVGRQRAARAVSAGDATKEEAAALLDSEESEGRT